MLAPTLQEGLPSLAELALELVETPIALLDEHLAVVSHNKAFLRCIGRESPPSALPDAMPELQTSKAVRKLKRRGRFTLMGEGISRRGKTVAVEYVLNPSGESGWVIEAIDRSRMQESNELLENYSKVIEQKNRELALSEVNLLDNLRQAVFAVNRAGEVVEPVSKFAAGVFGVDIIGKPLESLLFAESASPARLPWQAIGQRLQDWDEYACQLPSRVPYRRADRDEPRELKLTANPNLNENGNKIARVLFVVEDVTELTRLERDNERKLKEIVRQHESMRLLLDNVAQGFFSVDRDGRVRGQCSSIVHNWFGGVEEGQTLWELLDWIDAEFAENFELGWWQVADDFLPVDVALGQLPKTLDVGGRHFQFDFVPVDDKEACERIVVVVTDQTAELERGRNEQSRQHVLEVLERGLEDRQYLRQFVLECDDLLRLLGEDVSPPVAMRALHTLKGNMLLWGLRGLGSDFHDIEEAVSELGLAQALKQLPTVMAEWERLKSQISFLLEADQPDLYFTEPDYADCVELARKDTRTSELAVRLEAWSKEPTLRVLQRFAASARGLAERLDVDLGTVLVEDHGLRLATQRLTMVWASVTHILRNAIDHGLRGVEGRVPTLRLATRLGAESFIIEIEDNGNGVDWDRVREKAESRGLVVSTHEHLMTALFSDGLSTREEVTEISGRGVGLAAVQAAVTDCGGTIAVRSLPGHGTLFSMRFPRDYVMTSI